jgi:hypothetical protein
MFLFYRCFCSLAMSKPWRRRVLMLVIEIDTKPANAQRSTSNAQRPIQKWM